MHALLCLRRGEIGLAQEWFDKTIAYATEHGFPYWVTLCSLLKDWLLAQQGQLEVGTARFRRGLDAYRATGARLGLSSFLSLLAGLYGQSGQIEDGLRVIAEALAHIDTTGECYEPEVRLRKGELLLMQGGPDAVAAAEADFLQALAVARRQSARSLELPAATSLARLWGTQGRSGEARELLASVYGGFTEGLDRPDLKEARRLLEELGAVS
jgi:predicted ATPase